jgi:predicted N-acyltransferase
MLTVKKFPSILDIDERLWNSILKPADIYNTHQFVRTVEESKIENAQFFYFLFYDKDQLAGSAVVSAFNISLDLFIASNKLVSRIKSIFPNLFTVKLLVCGLPASLGQLNLAVADEKYANNVSSLIAGEMSVLAKQLKIKVLAIKELQEKEKTLFSQFSRENYFLAPSIPYMSMEVLWENFEAYLASMRHHYRRKILLSLKKMNVKKPVLIPLPAYDRNSEQAAWVLSKPDVACAEDFHAKYLNVMERTPTKLETLNQEFFKRLFQQEETYEVLSLMAKGQTIGSALLVHQGDVLNFMLVGRECAQDDYDSYFNMVYGIVELAIERRCKTIKLGQTAYWVKQCVGGTPKPEYIYFASRVKVLHILLKALRKVIFPELKLQSLQVFHER